MSQTLKKILFRDEEIPDWCRRFGLDPADVTKITIEIGAPGTAGIVRFDCFLREGDLEALGGQAETGLQEANQDLRY